MGYLLLVAFLVVFSNLLADVALRVARSAREVRLACRMSASVAVSPRRHRRRRSSTYEGHVLDGACAATSSRLPASSCWRSWCWARRSPSSSRRSIRPYIDPHWQGTPLPPCFQTPRSARGHPLGTDEVGRDLLSRLLFGARISLTVGLFAVIMEVVIGTIARRDRRVLRRLGRLRAHARHRRLPLDSAAAAAAGPDRHRRRQLVEGGARASA